MTDRAERYTYRVFRDDAEDGWVATVVDWPGLSFAAATQAEALAGVTDVVREALALMDLDGRTAPAPVRARPYSGRFVVRITPELHRALAAQAAEQNVSLNHLATEKLAA